MYTWVISCLSKLVLNLRIFNKPLTSSSFSILYIILEDEKILNRDIQITDKKVFPKLLLQRETNFTVSIKWLINIHIIYHFIYKCEFTVHFSYLKNCNTIQRLPKLLEKFYSSSFRYYCVYLVTCRQLMLCMEIRLMNIWKLHY